MKKRRKLTEAEKIEAREKARRENEAARPGYRFAVAVEDWTDNDGKAIVRAIGGKKVSD